MAGLVLTTVIVGIIVFTVLLDVLNYKGGK
jgi:hypothetical protein